MKTYGRRTNRTKTRTKIVSALRRPSDKNSAPQKGRIISDPSASGVQILTFRMPIPLTPPQTIRQRSSALKAALWRATGSRRMGLKSGGVVMDDALEKSSAVAAGQMFQPPDQGDEPQPLAAGGAEDAERRGGHDRLGSAAESPTLFRSPERRARNIWSPPPTARPMKA